MTMVLGVRPIEWAGGLVVVLTILGTVLCIILLADWDNPTPQTQPNAHPPEVDPGTARHRAHHSYDSNV